jgi:hypothetical protein
MRFRVRARPATEHQDVAVIGTWVVIIGGTFALCVRYNGCGHRDP